MEYAFRPSVTPILLVIAVLAALVVVPASAQVSKGSISGTAVDPSGAAVPEAQIKAVDTATSQVFTTTTENNGFFRLNLLPVGVYTVEVAKSGFRKTVMSHLPVNSNIDSSIGEVKLELGVTTETVEVTGTAPIVEATQAQITDTFSTTYLSNLPGIQENEGLDNLAVLLPGVSGVRDNAFSNTNGGNGFSVNGLRGRDNDQQIDGQNNNDNSVAGPSIFLSNAEFVDQYQITTNNFGAEYGRNAGSVVNVVTKAGTNNWHGSIFGTESNSVLNTLSNIQKAPVSSGFGEGLKQVPHFNDSFFGATIGGPWVKNKVFFFGGYDTEVLSSNFLYQNTNLTPTVAGIAELASCYTSAASQQSIAALSAFGPYSIGGGHPTPLSPSDQMLSGIDPNTGSPFPGFVANNADKTCHVNMGGIQRTLPNGTHEYDWITRLDVTGAKDTVYGRYVWQKISVFDADSFVSGYAALGYPNNVPSTGQQLGISWTHSITPRMNNELRLNYGRLRVEFGGNTIGNTVPHQGQLEDAVANVVFVAGNLAGYGPATNAPQGRIVNTYQVQDNWNYVWGQHQLKGGINYTYQRSPNLFLPNVNGRYRFLDWNAYGGNEPNQVRIALGNDNLDFREHDTFFYFGDDWKLTSRLTLNLGITYSYYGQPANLFHKSDLKQQTGSNPFWDPTLPQSVTVFPSIPAPKNSWGPSVGFAYAPGGRWFGEGKTVFRGGYRLAYDPPYYNIYLNISSAAPQVLLQSLTGATAGASPIPAAPLGSNVRAALASVVTPGVFDPRNFNASSVTPNFGPDRAHEWSFVVQRELGSHAAAEARYVGNHGEKLFQSINKNPDISGLAATFPNLLPSGLTPCATPVVSHDAGRVDCNGYAVNRERTNTGYSYYNGLQTEFRTNSLFNQLTMKTNYTFSKTLDNVSEIFGTFAGGGTNAFSQNPLDFKRGEYGLSGLDFRHTWTLSFAESLPMFRSQHGFLGHALGGWSLAGSYIWQTGQPYTPTQFFYNAFTGGCCSDARFNNAFIGTFDTARPFYGNPSAPAASVGAFAGDTCSLNGDAGSCALPVNQLIDYSPYNAAVSALSPSPPVNPVSASQVRYILNGAEADTVFGTPFGNVRRNQVRDAITNTANFQVSKTTKWGERASVTWHMSMVNAFNHPNYGYNLGGADPAVTFGGVDPFIDIDAGLHGLGTGFANPKLFDAGHRTIRFGIKVAF
jgi:hypothetical protein